MAGLSKEARGSPILQITSVIWLPCLWEGQVSLYSAWPVWPEDLRGFRICSCLHRLGEANQLFFLKKLFRFCSAAATPWIADLTLMGTVWGRVLPHRSRSDLRYSLIEEG